VIWLGQVSLQRPTETDHAQSRPGNMGFPLSISANTQPTLHMSIARVYSLNVSMTSGARYHLSDASDGRLGGEEGARTVLRHIRS